jgi:hypothetical protein
VIVIASVALGERAAAEPSPRSERATLERRLAELKRQAREIQEQIRRVEAELGREPPAASAPVAATQPPSTVDCALPFYMDDSGLKRVRSECLEMQMEAACEMPFILDDNGMRRVRPACGSVTPPPETRSTGP